MRGPREDVEVSDPQEWLRESAEGGVVPHVPGGEPGLTPVYLEALSEVLALEFERLMMLRKIGTLRESMCNTQQTYKERLVHPRPPSRRSLEVYRRLSEREKLDER
jgi:hypothetical protein